MAKDFANSVNFFANSDFANFQNSGNAISETPLKARVFDAKLVASPLGESAQLYQKYASEGKVCPCKNSVF
jgi:hypothetical protein